MSDTTSRLASSTLARVARYTGLRAALLAFTLAAGLFLAVVVVNYGGYIDQMIQANIDESLNSLSLSMPGASQAEIKAAYDQARWTMQEQAGLHQPFLLRCVRWWTRTLTFRWGRTTAIQAFRGTLAQRSDVLHVILERLPNTLLLAGSANLLLFFAALWLALSLSRRHASWLDRIVVALSPISSIPNWIYGILLTVVFAGQLHLLPFGGMYDEFPPAHPIGYIPIVLKHMILPVAAISLGAFFQAAYSWRTYFLTHSAEDHVEMARAKGLPPRMIERRYILRPALPYTLTSFALMLVGFWQGVLILELFFRWPGVGWLFLQAVRLNDRGLSVGIIALFAFLLALSIFLLDILYALVDPRLKLGGPRPSLRPASRQSARLPRLFLLARRPARSSPPSSPLPAYGWTWDAGAAPPGAARDRREPASRGPARRLGTALRALLRYPSALFGLIVILLVAAVAVYAVLAIPYDRAVLAWRSEAADKYLRPKNAMPAWVNLFRADPLPATVLLDTRAGTASKTVAPAANGATRLTFLFTFDYRSGTFPQDLALYFTPTYQAKKPFVTLTWLPPDGRELDLGSFSVVTGQSYFASQSMPRRLVEAYTARQQQFPAADQGGRPAVDLLFADPTGSTLSTLRGPYTLRVDAYTFEPASDLDAKFVLYGTVYGLAGTDDQNRDLLVALLWGAPIALSFGLLGAVVTTLLSMLVAAVGAWFGGWIDDLIQRLTEINIILPALPLAIMIYYLYSDSIWAILAVMVALGILGPGVKTYRAAFLQVKEAPYVEAARAYGARDGRIIRHYLFPRIVPLLVPQLVTLVPTYVFFETSLAYLGISDPRLPTWGKVVYDALTAGAYRGHYYWVLEPLALMMLTALAFAMLGFALDVLLNPRLRTL